MKVTNLAIDIISPLKYNGEIKLEKLTLFCGKNGSGKTLHNKLNYFGRYILASIPKLLHTKIFESLTQETSPELEKLFLEKSSFIENLQGQLDNYDNDYFNTLFNGIILPDLFEENNLTGSFIFSFVNDEDYKTTSLQFDNSIRNLTIPDIPDGMELSEEDLNTRKITELKIGELKQSRDKLREFFVSLDLINSINLKFIIDNNKFQRAEIELDVKEFPEEVDFLSFMDQRVCAGVLFGNHEFPIYLTASNRNFAKYNTFKKILPTFISRAQETCQSKSDDYQALQSYWTSIHESLLNSNVPEDLKKANELQERLKVTDFFFQEAYSFYNKKEFLELMINESFSVMDIETFLKIDKFKEAIKENGFRAITSKAGELIDQLSKNMKIDDIIVYEDTLCILHDSKKKTCANLSLGEQSVIIMLIIPFFEG